MHTVYDQVAKHSMRRFHLFDDEKLAFCLVEDMEEANASALFEMLCVKGVSVVKGKDERKRKLLQVEIEILEEKIELFFSRILRNI